MKMLFKTSSAFLLLALFLFSSCEKDDRSINLNLSEVTAFYAPNDNIFVQLEPATSASVGFEWEQARAEDGALVMYEVAFDVEDGDFSTPIYKMASDGNGVQNSLNLSHRDLNRIANFAGIPSLERGKLKWTVLASKGTNVRQATLSRTIEVARPAGFAEIPTEVFLTGSATEAGDDPANAIKMKSTAPGVYEIYTSLKPGTYNFLNRADANATSYQIEGTALKEGGAVESPADDETVYRLELDFNNAAVNIYEVKELAYWFAPRNAKEAILTYDGNGIFSAADHPVEFKQEGWGRDERYKFRMTLEDMAGNEIIEDWGSSNRDNSRPDGGTAPEWYQLNRVDVSQWDYTFKFPGEADMATVDLIVDFNTDGPYTHQVVIQ